MALSMHQRMMSNKISTSKDFKETIEFLAVYDEN